jgi:hypothetical protein
MPDLTPAALRLLAALAGEGAYGFRPEPDEPGILALVGRLNGVSLRRASATLAAAAELESKGFAAWRGSAGGRRRRLVLTVEGWARLVATAAPTEILAVHAPPGAMSPQAEADICP